MLVLTSPCAGCSVLSSVTTVFYTNAYIKRHYQNRLGFKLSFSV